MPANCLVKTLTTLEKADGRQVVKTLGAALAEAAQVIDRVKTTATGASLTAVPASKQLVLLSKFLVI